MSDRADEKEIWRQYPEYPWIEVSNLGRVRTKDRIVTRKNGRKYHVKGKVLKQYLNNMGYVYVRFSVNGKTVQLYVHRAVSISFLPNPHNYPEVNHKDNNPKNNAVSNLEWCDRQYNEAYKKNFGTSQAEVSGRPVIAINLDTSDAFCFESLGEAARQIGASAGNVCSVLKGRYKKTHGFWFCYADENAVERTRAKFGDDVAKKVEELMRQN